MLWKIIISFWKRFYKIDNRWFYSKPPKYTHAFFKTFINGDLLILGPLCVAIFLIGLWSIKLMLILLGSYIAIRYFGEMIYWILEQKKPAKDKTHRPYDFGLKDLDNHAIYILYQTIAIAWIVFGIMLVLWAFLYV